MIFDIIASLFYGSLRLTQNFKFYHNLHFLISQCWWSLDSSLSSTHINSKLAAPGPKRGCGIQRFAVSDSKPRIRNKCTDDILSNDLCICKRIHKVSMYKSVGTKHIM